MSKWNELKSWAEAVIGLNKTNQWDWVASVEDGRLGKTHTSFALAANPAAILELIAENSSLKDLLAQAAAMIRNADVETGVCCCGSPVETHGFGDGHSPVDQGGYYALDLLARIDAAMQEASQ